MSPTVSGTSRYLDLRALGTRWRTCASPRAIAPKAPTAAAIPRGNSAGAGEFVDYREYSDGEDLRRLDWKVLGRSGRAYVRLYQDETNLCCTFAAGLQRIDAIRRRGRMRAARTAARMSQARLCEVSHDGA